MEEVLDEYSPQKEMVANMRLIAEEDDTNQKQTYTAGLIEWYCESWTDNCLIILIVLPITMIVQLAACLADCVNYGVGLASTIQNLCSIG